jgi:nucleotide-binding universal stress UspA family protein
MDALMNSEVVVSASNGDRAMRIRRILLGLGGTEYTPVAVRHAVELARRHEAEITAVTVVDERRLTDVGPVPIGGARAALGLQEYRMELTRQRLREAVALFKERCEADQIPFRVREEKGEAFSLMTDLARYHDVMVFGLRSVFDCGLGVDPQDTLARLVRSGVRPLVAVSREYRPIRRVLLAYSGSAESAKASKRFVQSHLWAVAETRLLTCAPFPESAKPLLADMAAYCRSHGFEPDMEHSDEPPRTRILASAAEWEADLIVLGNGVRSAWLDRFLGGVTAYVVENADRPLYLSQ